MALPFCGQVGERSGRKGTLERPEEDEEEAAAEAAETEQCSRQQTCQSKREIVRE